MKTVQRHDTRLDFIWALTRIVYYFILLPCALLIAMITLIISINSSFRYSLFTTDYFILAVLWLTVLIPLGFRRFAIVNRRHKLKKMVTIMSNPERFSPQKQHQVMDAGRGHYLGIDIQRGTILYIHMAKKGIIDVIGLTMSDWTNRELEGGVLQLYTRIPDVPVLSVYAHPTVSKGLFNTLGAMSHNSYTEPFPNEPWPEFVRQQSRFVEFEHNVVVPQVV